MPIAVFLGGQQAIGYSVQLGPLRFVTVLDDLTEMLGGSLEAVGAAVAATERKPRPFKLSLPVHGGLAHDNKILEGQVLRRQVRQLLDNRQWPLLYFVPEWDPEMACWLMVGGGELSDAQGGIIFAEWKLELADCYMVGRPGTHRPARRVEVYDRRTGLVPRDSKGTLFSTDFSSQVLPSQQAMLPGDITQIVGAGGALSAATAGDQLPGLPAGGAYAGRRLWRSADSVHGEAESYVPVGDFASVDEPGSVRVWNTSHAIESEAGTIGEIDPTYFGWERVYGDLLDPTDLLAIDNGVCRLLMQPSDRVSIERWNPSVGLQGGYDRAGSVWHRNMTAGSTQITVVEITSERAIIALRQANHELRLILQRGWRGPRVEAYTDTVSAGTGAIIEYSANGTVASNAMLGAPNWVREITVTGQPYRRVLITKGQSSDVCDATLAYLSGAGARVACASSLLQRVAAQFAIGPEPTGDQVASLSLVDARATPWLVART